VIFSKLGKQTLYAYGIELSLRAGRLHLEIHHAAFDDFDGTMVPVIMDAKESLPEGAWSHVAVVLDGQRHNRGRMDPLPSPSTPLGGGRPARRFAVTRWSACTILPIEPIKQLDPPL
jgi:hypothetical protein